MDGLNFRASFAEGFRAPSIGALYSGNSDSYPTLQDPCDVNSANFTGNADGTQTGQCLADGVPTGFTQPNDQIRITVGGNPLVQPEVSESFNVGMTYQSPMGWNIFADYYDVEVDELIGSIGAQLILNGCYTGTDPDYCSLIDRQTGGFVADLRNTANNVGNLVTSGVEVGGSYDFSTAYGDFAVSSEARMLDNYDVTLANGDVVYNAGYVLGGPRANFVDFKMNTAVQWSMGNMFASVTFTHYGEGNGVANNAPTLPFGGTELVEEDVRDIDAITYVDVQYGMFFPEYDATLRVGLDNVFDEDPTFFPETFANDFDPMYRTWGSQAWYMNLSMSF
jgi:outer membrane receptor protein involved in Fe transport